MQTILKFLNEVRDEVLKMTWPVLLSVLVLWGIFVTHLVVLAQNS